MIAMLRSLFVAGSLLAGVWSLPAGHDNLVLHEKRDALLTHHSHEKRRVEDNSIIPLRIGLRQNDLESGYDRLMDVSHPASRNYGKHLSAEEVHDIFAPSPESAEIVKEWLLESGVDADDILEYANRGWLAVDLPVSHVEALLSAEYFEYTDDSGKMRIGCDEYHLPAHIAEHVDLIKPAIQLSAPSKKRVVKRQGWGSPGPGWGNPVCHVSQRAIVVHTLIERYSPGLGEASKIPCPPLAALASSVASPVLPSSRPC